MKRLLLAITFVIATLSASSQALNINLPSGGKIQVPWDNVDYVDFSAALVNVPNDFWVNHTESKTIPAVWAYRTNTTNTYYTVVSVKANDNIIWGYDDSGNQGYNQLVAVDDQAGAGISGNDNCITFEKAGFYTLVFDVQVANDSKGRQTLTNTTLHVYPAHAYVIGSVVGDFTDSDPSWELTAPDDNGNWVSPAFTNDGELRAYVKVPGHDWWRTEFTIHEGRIHWRTENVFPSWAESVGADYSVSCSAGQKLYVNFETETAYVE